MWPRDPDPFIPVVSPPEGHDRSAAWFFVFLRGELLCISEGGIPRPITGDEYKWLDLTISTELFLGTYENRACFVVDAVGSVPENYALAGLRAWLGRAAPNVFYLAGRAQQLLDWHRDYRFCGRCGAHNQDHPVDRAKQCPDCGLISYPRISPSIIVLIHKENEVLLARNAAWPTKMYSTLAGFVEPGESIEQTVHREVMEEVNLEVGDVSYLGSQSWPFPNSLMLGFHASYVGGDIVCQDGEIADAQWFSLENMPQIPPKTAISRWLIDDYFNSIK
ncbi:MAG: NAD(+) diphosphatase [Pseudomonadales bacterium]|nr:NAD(+) diphosphatase [Pseudomonadales bacterium]